MHNNKIILHFTASFILLSLLLGCNKSTKGEISPGYQTTKKVSYNGVNVTVVIDKPAGNEFDVLLVYHGTVNYDSEVLLAAKNTLDSFKAILDNKNMMIISVAYPEENLLFGDNIRQCEAALLWLKNNAAAELGLKVKKIFLAGHSQGGYQVTRLNTLHTTNGVIASAPGPLNLVYRCELEEAGQLAPTPQCTILKNTYGTTRANPAAYANRSLLNFTNGLTSDILFIQGLEDSPIQMYSWPFFKADLMKCTTCKSIQFVEIQREGHPALFKSAEAKKAFNTFITSRL
jgi:alpha/beta hydrolase fold